EAVDRSDEAPRRRAARDDVRERHEAALLELDDVESPVDAQGDRQASNRRQDVAVILADGPVSETEGSLDADDRVELAAHVETPSYRDRFSRRSGKGGSRSSSITSPHRQERPTSS